MRVEWGEGRGKVEGKRQDCVIRVHGLRNWSVSVRFSSVERSCRKERREGRGKFRRTGLDLSAWTGGATGATRPRSQGASHSPRRAARAGPFRLRAFCGIVGLYYGITVTCLASLYQQ